MQLIYQGNVYTYRRTAPLVAPRSMTMARPLFYGGQAFVHHRSAVESIAPKAVNWRFSASCTPKTAKFGTAYS